MTTARLLRTRPSPGVNPPGCIHPLARANRVGLRPRTLEFRKASVDCDGLAVCEETSGTGHSNLLSVKGGSGRVATPLAALVGVKRKMV